MSKKQQAKALLSNDENWRQYWYHQGALEPGNKVDLLVDGETTFAAMLKAIKGAQNAILMSSYIFNNDSIGQIFADALMARASIGVKTYLIVDGLGVINVPASFFERMERSGVNVLEYRSPNPLRRRWGILKRNHRKVLVVDGMIGFAGGSNIGDEWLPKEKGGLGWHDIHVRVEGPAVRELAKLELATWRVHGDIILDNRYFLPLIKEAGDVFVSIVGSRERKKRKSIRNSYLHAIKHAKKYIYIANAYFIPDSGFRRVLKNAVKRGVDVCVMVPAKGDIMPVQMASQALFGRLLRRGIRIFLWKDDVLHAKTAVIDDLWTTVGSYNIDRRSWAMNLEVNVNVAGDEFAQKLKNVFERDRVECEELTREKWRRRSWLQRLVERFFLLFRRFM